MIPSKINARVENKQIIIKHDMKSVDVIVKTCCWDLYCNGIVAQEGRGVLKHPVGLQSNMRGLARMKLVGRFYFHFFFVVEIITANINYKDPVGNVELYFFSI